MARRDRSADEFVTRREVDLLKTAADAEREKLWQRIELMDDHGTRGVQGLTVRLDEVVKDLAEIRAWQAGHEQEHRREADQRARERREDDDSRTTARRFTVTTTIAILVLLVAVLSVLLASHSR